MSLERLQGILQEQVNTNAAIQVSALTLVNAMLVPAEDFDKTLELSFLLKEPLSVSVTEAIPAPIANQLTVKGNASFLGLTAAITQVTFELEPNNTVNVLLVVELIPGWNFSTSFPSLTDYPFSKLSLSSPFYLVTTAVQTKYTWNEHPLTLQRGLNFASYLTLNGPLGILQYLISSLSSSDQLVFHGTIDTRGITDIISGLPIVQLTGKIDAPITAQTRFSLSIPEVIITTQLNTEGQVAYWLMFQSTLSVKDKPFSIFQAAIFPDSNVLGLNMLPSENPITPDQIIQLIDADYEKDIPSVMGDIFKAVQLKGLYASIDVKNLKLISLSGSIGTTHPWQMGQFTLEEMVLHCQTLFLTGSRATMIVFTARASLFPQIFTGHFEFEMSYEVAEKRLSIAACYQQKVLLNALVAGLSNNTITIPTEFAEIYFEDFGMSFTKKNDNYDYVLYGAAKGTFHIKILDSPIVATFQIFVDSAANTYILKGGLTIGNSLFEASSNLSGAKKILSCSWQALRENYLNIKDILTALHLPSLDIPSDLDLQLKSASISYDMTDKTFLITAESVSYGTAVFASVPGGGSRETFFLVRVNKTFSLSDLPLVGEKLAAIETIEVGKIEVIAGTGAASADTARVINGLIREQSADKYPFMPISGTTGKFMLSADINFGGVIISLSTNNNQQRNIQPLLSDRVTTALISNASIPALKNSVLVAPQSPDGTTWFDIQKNFGAINFKRVGVKYEEGILWFLLDAGFSAGGLSIELVGMAIGSPLSTFTPQFTLSGLGVDFSQPGLEIAGALMKIPSSSGVEWEFAGGVIIRVNTFSISALGSYASVYTDASHQETVPSLFVFGQVTGSFGGPPAFFVTGLAGGFGYNSSLRLPAMGELYQFPLVGGAQDPAKIGGKGATPVDVLKTLMDDSQGKAWVTHDVGQYWFAAGVQFSTFSLVSTNALLVVLFGKQLKFALLGLSRAQFPMAGQVRYAFIELQIEVIVDPNQGVFSLTSILSSNSYLLDPSCKLTGGFAFFAWYEPSVHAGDFVITLGGYHPSFDPPAWYPQVPRVGFSWSLDSTVSITGTAYFALTPSAIMAGGQLSVTYSEGNLKAWFRAWTNMLIYYNPFHFDAEIGVTVGASYRMNWGFTTSTIEAELGATLHIYGPATGGTVAVHWYIISFTINFGASPSGTPKPLNWEQFKKQLPASADMIKLIPGHGLAANGSADMNDGSPWIVRPVGFSLSITSSVPNSSLLIDQAGTLFQQGSLINIRAMQDYSRDGNATKGKNLTSTQQITLTRDGNTIKLQEANAAWTITARKANLPKALWGVGPQDQIEPGTAQLMTDLLTGFDLQAPASVTGYSPGPLNAAVHLSSNTIKTGVLPVQPGQNSEGPVAGVGSNTINLIEHEIANDDYEAKRTQLFDKLASLEIDQLKNEKLDKYARWAGGIFEKEPLIIAST